MRVAAYTQLSRTRSPSGVEAHNPTGVGQHLIHMVKGLARAPGVSLTVVAPRNQLDEAGNIPWQNPLAGIPARGVPVDRRWLEALSVWLNAPKLDRWCEGADWVYTPTEAYVAVRRSRLAVTVHDLHAFETNLPWSSTAAHQSLRRRWASMFGPIVMRADRILAVSDFTRRRLVELVGAEYERIAVVGNGVDEAFFNQVPDDEPGEYRGQQYLLVIGGLTRRKGGDLVLRAAAAFQHHMPNLRLLVAGRGEQYLEDLALQVPNVTCLGFVGVSELIGLLRGAVAMMFLSRYEGFGIPIAEAMAAGTPVIASRSSAIPEVAGDAGLLVDAENTAEVVAAVKFVLSDRAARSELSARGRKRAEHYRWGSCVDRLLSALGGQ